MKKAIIISAICLTFITAKANNITTKLYNMLHTPSYILNKSSVPADPNPHTVKQPNGKMLTFFIKGDERIHWYETLDGYTLLYGESGHLEFACKDENGTLMSSGILAFNAEERGEEELSFLKETPKKLFFSDEQTKSMTGRFRH